MEKGSYSHLKKKKRVDLMPLMLDNGSINEGVEIPCEADPN